MSRGLHARLVVLHVFVQLGLELQNPRVEAPAVSDCSIGANMYMGECYLSGLGAPRKLVQ